MNEPKFQIHISLTECDYVRYNHAIVWSLKSTKWIVAISIVFGVLTLAPALFYYQSMSTISYVIFPLVCVFAVLWYYIIGIDRTAARTYKMNKMGVDTEILFYNDYLEFITANSRTIWHYDELQKIIITKTDIYVMHSFTTGLCIRKDICPEGFLEFIEVVKQTNNLA